MCVLNEVKMYKCDEFLEWLVYSSKLKALLIDNILYMAACSHNIFSVLFGMLVTWLIHFT